MTRSPTHRRDARPGFTLIEVMVALVVTGVLVALAYATAQAGFDTERRLAAHQNGEARDGAMRALITDALRHQVEGVRGGEVVFALSDRLDARGRPSDSLQLTTRGVVAPFGASSVWRVALWRQGDTLQLTAWPDHPEASRDTEVPIQARVEGVRTFDVRALGRGLAAAWIGTWVDGDVAPDAVALSFSRDGAADSHVLVRRGLERAP